MLTRASSRRTTRSSSTSERTRKHKIPKNHIDNIFVKNMRQHGKSLLNPLYAVDTIHLARKVLNGK